MEERGTIDPIKGGRKNIWGKKKKRGNDLGMGSLNRLKKGVTRRETDSHRKEKKEEEGGLDEF